MPLIIRNGFLGIRNQIQQELLYLVDIRADDGS